MASTKSSSFFCLTLAGFFLSFSNWLSISFSNLYNKSPPYFSSPCLIACFLAFILILTPSLCPPVPTSPTLINILANGSYNPSSFNFCSSLQSLSAVYFCVICNFSLSDKSSQFSIPLSFNQHANFVLLLASPSLSPEPVVLHSFLACLFISLKFLHL